MPRNVNFCDELVAFKPVGSGIRHHVLKQGGAIGFCLWGSAISCGNNCHHSPAIRYDQKAGWARAIHIDNLAAIRKFGLNGQQLPNTNKMRCRLHGDPLDFLRRPRRGFFRL